MITHAVDRIVLLDKATINPVGLLVDRANAGDALYFPPPAHDIRDDPPVVEPPADLSSWSTDPIGPEPTANSTKVLPQLDPDPTLAAALAARAALEVAHQPVTRDQLAARQAAVQDPDTTAGGPGPTDQAA